MSWDQGGGEAKRSTVARDKEQPGFPSSLEAILAIFADAREGAYDERLETLPADDPLAPVHEGINALLDALVRERRRSAACRDEIEAQQLTIELQQAAIREISAPIIEIGRGVLCLPLMGIVSAERGEEVFNTLLATVTAKSAQYVVVDVTGMSGMDNDTAQWLLRLTTAVRLLGTQCALAGIGPELARTMVGANFDLSGLITLSNVREALERFARVAEPKRRRAGK
jgi:rsbT co-antagonist protein RsbR